MSLIKLIIFDLDGVLVDSREHHFLALNEALKEVGEEYVISKKEHLTNFDGLPTKKKLEILTKERNLPVNKWEYIWKRKQELTFQIIKDEVGIDDKLVDLFKQLKADNIKIWVCSNSIRDTIKLILLKKGLIEYVDSYVSNEDVISSKPHPEMYWKAIVTEKVLPEETMIVEDSYVGRKAAMLSGAKLCPVKNPDEVTKDKIYHEMSKPYRSMKWVDKKLNVLIPMAGAGSRFAIENYKFPKPLIEVRKKPMIQVVVENLNIDANFIYVVQKKHYEEYNLQSVLNFITPNCKIVQVDGLTEGAACTCLLAKEYIDNENPLFISNSDQFIEWESGEFFHTMNAPYIDGGILTFEASHPKWSYVKLDDNGNVSEVKEKEVISNIATTGHYYFNKGSDFVTYAEKMINDNLRVKNEFYVAPIYNLMIHDNHKIKIFNIKEMWGLGTPEDLNYFLNNYKKEI
jgi:HAD superfamily hydrolase (TIGR01509 family)